MYSNEKFFYASYLAREEGGEGCKHHGWVLLVALLWHGTLAHDQFAVTRHNFRQLRWFRWEICLILYT